MKKILILTSNPRNELKLEQEIKDVQKVIQHSQNQSQFELEFEAEVEPEDLQRLLLKHKPEIVHFSGQGTGELGLVLQNRGGQEQLVSTEALSNLFAPFEQQVECVLLNASYSEVQADALVQHINYVIGMSHEISDDAAIAFTTGFYRALGAGQSLEKAYQLGCQTIKLQMGDKADTSPFRSPGTSHQPGTADVGEPVIIPEHLKPVLKMNPNQNKKGS